MATHKMRIGSKAQVWHGTAEKTSSGLRKSDLMMTKRHRVVSKKQHRSGLKAIKRLYKLGYKPKKGTFKAFKKGMRSTRRRGGNPEAGASTYGNNVSAGSAAALDAAMKALGAAK